MKAVLADTSVWVEFFRGDERVAGLTALLEDERVVMHPWVLGELVLGQLAKKGKKRKQRAALLADLRRLPEVATVDDRELLRFIEHQGLSGRGIGWLDVQLLASARATGLRLWTLDRKLASAAEAVAVAVAS